MATPHGDNHDMWINPRDGNTFIQSNDGGANVSRNGGATWSSQYNQPTAEIYQVTVDDQYPYRVYGAQQDQGSTLIVPSLPVSSLSLDDLERLELTRSHRPPHAASFSTRSGTRSRSTSRSRSLHGASRSLSSLHLCSSTRPS